MYTSIDTNVVTGEVTIREWTQEEIEARKLRLTPMKWDALRAKRNSLLEESDAYVLPDRWFSYDELKKAEWSTYRQALRDLPANTTDPFNPVWPVKP